MVQNRMKHHYDNENWDMTDHVDEESLYRNIMKDNHLQHKACAEHDSHIPKSFLEQVEILEERFKPYYDENGFE